MYPLIGHITKPFAYFGIRGLHIHAQAHLLESTGQRDVEIAAQITVKTLHLSLCARPIRSAQTRQESILLGQVKQLWVPAMMALAVGIALQHDGARVVVQNLRSEEHTSELQSRP